MQMGCLHHELVVSVDILTKRSSVPIPLQRKKKRTLRKHLFLFWSKFTNWHFFLGVFFFLGWNLPQLLKDSEDCPIQGDGTAQGSMFCWPLEDNVVDVCTLEHEGQHQPTNASSSNDDTEWSHDILYLVCAWMRAVLLSDLLWRVVVWVFCVWLWLGSIEIDGDTEITEIPKWDRNMKEWKKEGIDVKPKRERGMKSGRDRYLKLG